MSCHWDENNVTHVNDVMVGDVSRFVW